MATIYITGPQGPQGFQGVSSSGPQGAQGAQGIAGSSEGIQQVLIAGNDTMGEDIIFSSGSEIKSDGALILNYGSVGSGVPSLQGRSSGDQRGTGSVDLQNTASLATQVASGDYATISGGSNNTASGDYSIVPGGNSNIASGAQSAAIGSSNTASGTNSILIGNSNSNAGPSASSYAIMIGDSNSIPAGAGADNIVVGSDNVCGSASRGDVTGCITIGNNNTATPGFYSGTYQRSMAIGTVNFSTGYESISFGMSNSSTAYRSIAIGNACTASGQSSVSIGSSNIASAIGSCAIGGTNNTASSSYSRVFGLSTKSTVYGEDVFATGNFSVSGDARKSQQVLRCTTTNATPTKMCGDGSTLSTQYTLESGSMIKFTGQVVGKYSATNQVSGWDINGIAKRVGSTVTMVGVTVTANASNEFAGTVQVIADNTYGAIAIQVTGIVGTVYWIGFITAARVL